MLSWTSGKNRRMSRIPECLDHDLLKYKRHRAQVFVTARSEGFAQGLKMVPGPLRIGQRGKMPARHCSNRFVLIPKPFQRISFAAPPQDSARSDKNLDPVPGGGDRDGIQKVDLRVYQIFPSRRCTTTPDVLVLSRLTHWAQTARPQGGHRSHLAAPGNTQPARDRRTDPERNPLRESGSMVVEKYCLSGNRLIP